ncbi:hypothetical protein C8F01DRAFT_1373502 [Mycena amicta]|nr:hypothetical protein C8F01DRAFT_1373502 [Mycena amicta]
MTRLLLNTATALAAASLIPRASAIIIVHSGSGTGLSNTSKIVIIVVIVVVVILAIALRIARSRKATASRPVGNTIVTTSAGPPMATAPSYNAYNGPPGGSYNGYNVPPIAAPGQPAYQYPPVQAQQPGYGYAYPPADLEKGPDDVSHSQPYGNPAYAPPTRPMNAYTSPAASPQPTGYYSPPSGPPPGPGPGSSYSPPPGPPQPMTGYDATPAPSYDAPSNFNPDQKQRPY